MKKLVFSAAIAAFLALPLTASAQQMLDQSNPYDELYPGGSWGIRTTPSQNDGLAQIFTAGISGALTQVDIHARTSEGSCMMCPGVSGTRAPGMIVSIHAVADGVPTGGALASTTVSADTMRALNPDDDRGIPTTVRFSAPAIVSAGTQYAIVIFATPDMTDYGSPFAQYAYLYVHSGGGNHSYYERRVTSFANGQWDDIGSAEMETFFATYVDPNASVDNTPPTVTCSASPSSLWPPDHKMRNITVTVNVSDDGSGPDGFQLISVTSNEPATKDIAGFAQPGTSGQLRATRLGKGNGRVYTLTYQGSDVAGNTATCTTTVTVPHNQ